MITLKTYTDESAGAVNDIALDESGENFVFLEDGEALMEVLRARLTTRRFELQLSPLSGIPYFETIFAQSKYLTLWSSYMEDVILRTPHVRSLEYFTPQIEGTKLYFKALVASDFGEDELNGRYF